MEEEHIDYHILEVESKAFSPTNHSLMVQCRLVQQVLWDDGHLYNYQGSYRESTCPPETPPSIICLVWFFHMKLSLLFLQCNPTCPTKIIRTGADRGWPGKSHGTRKFSWLYLAWQGVLPHQKFPWKYYITSYGTLVAGTGSKKTQNRWAHSCRLRIIA